MGRRLEAWAWEVAPRALEGIERFTLLALCHAAPDEDSHLGFVGGTKALARMIGKSPRYTRIVLSRLERMKLIHRYEERGGVVYTVNATPSVFWPVPEAEETPAETPEHVVRLDIQTTVRVEVATESGGA